MNANEISVNLLVRYGTIGLSVALFQIVNFYILLNVFEINYLVASAVSFCLTVVASFFMQRLFVFIVNGERAIAPQHAFAISAANSIFGLGVNCLIMYGGVEYLHNTPLLWQVISMTVLPSYNFFFYRYVFRPLT